MRINYRIWSAVDQPFTFCLVLRPLARQRLAGRSIPSSAFRSAPLLRFPREGDSRSGLAREQPAELITLHESGCLSACSKSAAPPSRKPATRPINWVDFAGDSGGDIFVTRYPRNHVSALLVRTALGLSSEASTFVAWTSLPRSRTVLFVGKGEKTSNRPVVTEAVNALPTWLK